MPTHRVAPIDGASSLKLLWYRFRAGTYFRTAKNSCGTYFAYFCLGATRIFIATHLAS